MSKSSALAGVMENFINSWNHEFPNFELTVEDLKRPHAFMGALFHIFDRIGIDREAVLQPPPEGDLNAHIGYNWDLLPVINMTRIMNHLMAVDPQMPTITINYFLQPSAHTSHSILLFLFNLMMFKEGRLQSIVPYEEELIKFSLIVEKLEEERNDLIRESNTLQAKRAGMMKQVEEYKEKIRLIRRQRAKRDGNMEQLKAVILKELEEFKNDVIRQLNTKAIEQAERVGKMMEQMNQKFQQLEEEIRQEELLLAERERKKVLRVYDAEDVRSQIKESEEVLLKLETEVKMKIDEKKPFDLE